MQEHGPTRLEQGMSPHQECLEKNTRFEETFALAKGEILYI